MNPELKDIKSIINNSPYAKDKERVFTYIEFVKMFGFQNDANTFITHYKEYLTKWAAIKKQSITLDDGVFVFSKLVDTLKAITLDYSSYEQQDFIAHIDLSNKAHLKSLTALYSRKIREITEFYRKKRNEAPLIVRKNSMKGSTKSVQEVIYEKVFDFVFSNRNVVKSYKDIKRDLLVSIQTYIDTYSEYFDIPRKKQFTDDSRAEMLTANMNDVDYRMYLEIQLVVSEILFSGNVMLQEIPLIAQLGMDLSQNCVGDMLALKNTLLQNTTINQVDINEQIALKRRLYQKFLGCDLWYLYVDLQGNIKMDMLCKAYNPTGNLLNCGTPDTATIQSDSLELMSHIGLFFKPDKTSILKVNAKDYTWTIDETKLIEDTVYIFPDPNRYGDIGNNKSQLYPLIMEYKLDWDIKNLSSGEAKDDPMIWITDQGWASYYSKQDDDFKVFDNINYEYAFTYLANQGYLFNYQKDIWGNQFGLLKGSNVTYKTDEDGKIITDEEGNPIVDKITLVNKYNSTQMKNGSNEDEDSKPILLNGGYMEDPFYQGTFGKKIVEEGWRDKANQVPFVAVFDDELGTYRRLLKDQDATNKKTCYIRSIRYNVPYHQVRKSPQFYEQYKVIKTTWVYQGIENNTRPFNFDKKFRMTDTYNWSGLSILNPPKFYLSTYDNNFVNYGFFGAHNAITYEDHFQVIDENNRSLDEQDNIITEVINPFLSVNLLDEVNKKLNDITIQTTSLSFEQMKQSKGQIFVKLTDSIQSTPKKLQEVFPWIDAYVSDNIVDFSVIHQTIIIETDTQFLFVPYLWNGSEISNPLGINQLYKLDKSDYIITKLLYNELKQMFYILQIEKLDLQFEDKKRRFLLPKIYQFNPRTYQIRDLINVYDAVYSNDYIEQKLQRCSLFSLYVSQKQRITKGDKRGLLKKYIEQRPNIKFLDFQIPYFNDQVSLGQIGWSYNSNLGTYLMAFLINDKNGTPYIHQYRFKIDSLKYLHDSMISNIYTIKSIDEDQVYYRYNNDIYATEIAMIPNVQDIETRIFTEYED